MGYGVVVYLFELMLKEIQFFVSLTYWLDPTQGGLDLLFPVSQVNAACWLLDGGWLCLGSFSITRKLM